MPRASTVAAIPSASPCRTHRRSLRIGVLATAGAALVALLFPAVHRPQLRLVWNASASVPLGLYHLEPGIGLRVGDLVGVRPSPSLTQYMAERRYVESGALLVKPVAAVNGATVCRRGLRVTIDGRSVVTALVLDRLGRPLPSWSGCLRLSPGQLFLVAPATPTSFDSRYFGAVRRADIVGRATPLWTWS